MATNCVRSEKKNEWRKEKGGENRQKPKRNSRNFVLQSQKNEGNEKRSKRKNVDGPKGNTRGREGGEVKRGGKKVKG